MNCITVVAESIDVNDSSGSKVNVSLIYNLRNAGYNIKVLHYSHKEIQLTGIECKLIKEKKFTIWYILTRLQRLQIRLTGWNLNPILEFVLGFSFSHTSDTRSIVSALRKQDFSDTNFILTLSKGGSFRPHRAMLRLKNLHKKWIAYIHDPYPFHFYPRPYNWVEAAHSRKQQLMQSIVSSSFRVSFPSQLLGEWMTSYFPEIKEKSMIIPHQIAADHPQNVDLPDYFDLEKFNLLHAGNLLGYRDPHFLIEAILNLIGKKPEMSLFLKLHLIGPHDYFHKYLEQYSAHPNINVKGYTEYNVIQAMEAASSVNIILEAISEISPFLPGKFPNCIYADKPVLLLGPYYSESRRLLGENYQYWSESDDVSRIESHIEQLYNNWQQNVHTSLNRPDLKKYLGPDYLLSTFNALPVVS